MYQHFTQEERYEIDENITEKRPKREIAARLGQHISSVYREINLNTGQRGYRQKQADEKARARPPKVLGFQTPAEVFFSNTIQLSHL
jgi:transposase, IS30 family